MRSEPLRLSIVVPTFNESANVSELLRRVDVALAGVSWELIFVDDDSPDGTAAAVRAIAREDSRVRCLQRVGRRGLSSACIEGMLAASAPIVAVMDADLQHDEAILPRMLQAAEDGAEVVVGTRYAQGGSTGEWDESRKSMSLLATRMSGLILKQPVSDPMSGFFMLRREVLEGCVHELSGMGFKILLDLLASSKRALRVAEVPYVFRDRQAGESKLDSMVVWEYGMLLADKTIGRFVPVRFLVFSLIGGLGVFVHMGLLTAALKGLAMGFTAAQTVATLLSMVFNFALNNQLTYRDRRLTGWGWWRGLASFMVACGIGAVANIGIATWLFEHDTRWVLAAVAGILVGAVWNYAVTQLYTWGKKK
ncbi:MAG TPA: glycosyltransferase family 2 protein [Pseudorhodoferax sp.]|nr:glycosyltransferase family 2 protein [Pseudorhodoferax sp.]